MIRIPSWHLGIYFVTPLMETGKQASGHIRLPFRKISLFANIFRQIVQLKLAVLVRLDHSPIT